MSPFSLAAETEILASASREFATGQWSGTWAFPIAAAAAQREGYDKTELHGSFGFVEGFWLSILSLWMVCLDGLRGRLR